jgi:hypothetical protein
MATKLTLWTALVSLATWVLLWPTKATLTSDDPQLVGVVNSLAALGIVFSLWFVLWLLLAVRAQGHTERVFLACVAAMVLLGFKLHFVPAGGLEGVYHAAHAKFLMQEGSITFSQSNLTYFEFPAIHLMAATLASITGLSVLQVTTHVLFVQAALFAALLYLTFARLARPSYALIGSLLAIAGSEAYARGNWHPGTWGLILLTLFVLLLLPRERQEQQALQTWPHKLVAAMVVLALTITHFVTAVVVLFILTAIVLAQRYTRLPSVHATASTLTLFSVIPLTWLVYVAGNTFSSLAQAFADLSREGALTFPLSTTAANAGARIPVWASGIRLLWLAVPWSIGGLVFAHNLLRLRHLEAAERTLSVAFVGVLFLVTAAFVVEPAFTQYYRVLMYGPIFLTPLVLRKIPALGQRTFRVALAGAALLVVLSFPTFLAHGDLVSTNRMYEQEARAGEFLSSTAGGNGEGPTVFSGVPMSFPLLYWLPEGDIISEPTQEHIANQDEFWREIDRLASQFLRSERGQSPSTFLFTDRLRFSYEHWIGVPPTDARWVFLENSLESTDRIYEDGMATVYAR